MATTQPEEVEYSCLQHKTNTEEVSSILPSCSPQLYSILDSPHRPAVASYDSVESTGYQHHHSEESLSDGSSEPQHHKPFQPISYLPPKSSSERRHRRTNSHRKHVRHHHSDSSIKKKRHSTPSKDDHLRNNEFLVKGTTLDGSVTLYAATPIGSPLPVDQAQPIFNKMSTSDHHTTTATTLVGQSAWHQLPSMTHQQQPPPASVLHSRSMPCTSSVDRFDPVTGTVLDQAISLDHSTHNQSVNIPETISQPQPISTNFDPHQEVMSTGVDHQGTRTTDQHHQGGLIHLHHQGNKTTEGIRTTDQHNGEAVTVDQHYEGVGEIGRTSGQHTTSLYQDMLGLMQKREAELKLELSNITLDKNKLQSENSRLLQENTTLRNDTSSM